MRAWTWAAVVVMAWGCGDADGTSGGGSDPSTGGNTETTSATGAGGESVSDGGGGAGAAGGGEPLLEQGFGDNIPDGGQGWTHLYELDVSQPDQAALQGSLGTLGVPGFVGARWTQPDAAGTGAYFDEVHDGLRCMRFHWGVGNDDEGRAALHEIGAPSAYQNVYARLVFAYTTAQHWPSGGVKMIMWDPGNVSVNAQMPNGEDAPPPYQWLIGNIGTSNGGVQYRSLDTYGPSTFDTWTEMEFIATINSAGGFDGIWDEYIDGVRISSFDEQAGPLSDQTAPSNIQFAPGSNPGLTSLKVGPYLGGQGNQTVDPAFGIRFATISVWVR